MHVFARDYSYFCVSRLKYRFYRKVLQVSGERVYQALTQHYCEVVGQLKTLSA